ncbi:hypothetical protein [Bradyrhizobium sp. USDA 3364]
MSGIIAETCRSSQTLDGFPASRDVICGFFAATVLAWGRFLCKQATVTESKPRRRTFIATWLPQMWTLG